MRSKIAVNEYKGYIRGFMFNKPWIKVLIA